MRQQLVEAKILPMDGSGQRMQAGPQAAAASLSLARRAAAVKVLRCDLWQPGAASGADLGQAEPMRLIFTFQGYAYAAQGFDLVDQGFDHCQCFLALKPGQGQLDCVSLFRMERIPCIRKTIHG